MPNYKPTTQQIFDWSKAILNHLKSDVYKAAINTQDIKTVNSPYKNGEQTLSDAIQMLMAMCRVFQQDVKLLDRIDYNQRQNIYNTLQNVYQWITSDPIGNWNNIISHVNNIVLYSTQSGLSPFDVHVDGDLKKKLLKFTIADEEISALQELRLHLTAIDDASEKLEEAKKIIDFVKDTGRIEELVKYVESGKSDIDGLRVKAEELLGASSNAAMVQHFSDVAKRYRDDIYGRNADKWYKPNTPGWRDYFVLSVVLFAANILLVILVGPKLDYANEYLELLANGSVRIISLMPSLILLAFFSSNFSKGDKRRGSYEFKDVTAKTLEGHLIMLQNRGASPEVLGKVAEHILIEMYTEPSDNSSGNIDGESIEKSLSLMERIKVIFRKD